jgi:hypothetical protein
LMAACAFTGAMTSRISLSIPSSNVRRAEAGMLLPGADHCISTEMKRAW